MLRLALLAASLACAGALSVTASAGSPNVQLISVETRADGYHTLDKTYGKEEKAKQSQSLDPAIKNIYPEVKPVRWHGLATKVEIVNEWLKTQPEDDVIVFVDSDTFWGGCSKEQFLRDFEEITSASGANLVAGAEIGCVQALHTRYGFHCQRQGSNASYPEVADWAKTKYSLNADTFVGFADKECTTYEKGACESPPSARFLNSGFIAGKVKHLLKAYDFVMKSMPTHPKFYRQFNDMYAFNHYFYEGLMAKEGKPELTLDYGTRLVANLHGFQNGTKPLVELKDGVVKNMLTGETQCFIHGNGKSKELWTDLKESLMTIRKGTF